LPRREIPSSRAGNLSIGRAARAPPESVFLRRRPDAQWRILFPCWALALYRGLRRCRARISERGIMYLDLTAGSPLLLQTRTCVIGAGAAGITVARALLAAGQEVVLIESGGLDYEPETSDLNAGENVGQDYYDLE